MRVSRYKSLARAEIATINSARRGEYLNGVSGLMGERIDG